MLKIRKMEEVKKFIDTIYPMNPSDWDFFTSKLNKESVPKNTTLLKVGAVENYLSFIAEGVVRLYIPEEEQDVTFGFVFENEFVTAYDSFITRTPSEYQIETLTNASFLRISFTDLHEVYEKTESGKWQAAVGLRLSPNGPLPLLPLDQIAEQMGGNSGGRW